MGKYHRNNDDNHMIKVLFKQHFHDRRTKLQNPITFDEKQVLKALF